MIRTSVLCDWFLETPSSGGAIVVCKCLPSLTDWQIAQGQGWVTISSCFPQQMNTLKNRIDISPMWENNQVFHGCSSNTTPQKEQTESVQLSNSWGAIQKAASF